MESIEKDLLITQFKHLAEEVRFSKRQQMMATWYILLIYSAIVHTYKRWAFLKYTWVLPIIISLIFLLIGLYFIRSCKFSQENNNYRIRKVRERFMFCDEMTGDQSDPHTTPGKITCLIHLIACKEFCGKKTGTLDIPIIPDKVTSLYCLIHFFACFITVLIIIN